MNHKDNRAFIYAANHLNTSESVSKPKDYIAASRLERELMPYAETESERHAIYSIRDASKTKLLKLQNIFMESGAKEAINYLKK